MQWARSVGVDVMLDDIGSSWNLVTPAGSQGLVAVHVDNRLWDRASVRDLTRALSKPTTRLTARENRLWRRYGLPDHGSRGVGLPCPVTLMVRTAKDKIGLLQITSCVLEPQAITFRWKLFRRTADLRALLPRHEAITVAPDPEETRALIDRIEAAIIEANTAWNQGDPANAQTSIESVLALEAQCMAAVADTDVEPMWRVIMDQARSCRHALQRGESDEVARLIASLKETLNRTDHPGGE